jgi:hypothetical protein
MLSMTPTPGEVQSPGVGLTGSGKWESMFAAGMDGVGGAGIVVGVIMHEVARFTLPTLLRVHDRAFGGSFQ